MPEITLKIKNKNGLHAIPLSYFVKLANIFDKTTTITVKNGDARANGKDILSVLTLGADKGKVISIFIEGRDAEMALGLFKVLYDYNFGDNE